MPTARSHAHSRRHGRLALHGFIVSLVVAATFLASRMPTPSNAGSQDALPTFSFSGLSGSSGAGRADVLKPSASTLTQDSAARGNLRTEQLSIAAVGALLPTNSLSAGVAAAAATSGEVGAGVKPLADIIDPRSPIVEYRTQGGDSISGIAARYGISIETLLANNPTLSEKNINLVPRDAVLIVPRTDGILYKVGFGDTVTKIVSQYDAIDAATVLGYRPNNITDPNSLEQGRYVLLPGAKLKPPPPPPPPPPKPPAARPVPGVGTTPGGADPRPSGGKFSNFPLTSWYGISDAFGVPRGGGSYHTGIDLDMYGFAYSPVFAVCDGVVTKTEYLTYSYGYHVIVDCGDGWTTLYAHLSAISVNLGQRVTAGATLGMTGNTGFSTGHHLHFEIRLNGGYLNPALYLAF